ncbi:FACT complex subunit SSRP1-B [Hordeum vulgare]|nr:FACT complex subunit SSRP1-B [Hordeum vulgare]
MAATAGQHGGDAEQADSKRKHSHTEYFNSTEELNPDAAVFNSRAGYSVFFGYGAAIKLPIRSVSIAYHDDHAHIQHNLKNINPELSTTDIAKKLGEKWQKMSAEEKQPYLEQSQVDKKRYAEETAAYRGAGAAPVDMDSADGSSD